MNINEKWEQIPTFDDPSAKIETRVHPVSGSEIIEVLYGAAAAESVPTAQDNSQQGRWIAFKADGLCQLLYWRLPDGEVKQAFVSGLSEQPEITLEIVLKTLEQSIRARKSIIDEAYTLIKSAPYSPEAFPALVHRWEQCTSYGTPKEHALEQDWHKVQSKYEAFESCLNEKKALIEEAKACADSIAWKATSRKMQELMERWKKAGRSRKEYDDQLWQEFHTAKQAFYDHQEQYFKEQTQKWAQSKAAKQALIEEAGQIAASSTHWKSNGAKLDALREQMKAAGSAGHTADQALWREFNQICNAFYAKKKAHYEESIERFSINEKKKRTLLAEAEEILAAKDYSSASTQRMKQLWKEWMQSGFSGKESNTVLWEQFNEVQDSYFRSMRQEAIDRRKKRISSIQSNISTLQERLLNTINETKQAEITLWITQEQTKIDELEKAIHDMENNK